MEEREIDVTTEPKKRSLQAKKGRHRYNLDLLRRIEKRLDSLDLKLSTIFKGLEGMFHFEKAFIQKVACADEVDVEILQLLYVFQPDGLFPRQIATDLRQYHLDRFKVTRRLKAMNRRLEKEIGQHVAEKRGHHWALTGFAAEAGGETEKEDLTVFKKAVEEEE